MALNITTLVAAGALGSKNRRLALIFQLAVKYNNLPARAGNDERVDLLHLITRVAGEYLTSKPPQDHRPKNRQRWQGMTELLQQVGPEASRLGVRLLHGPSDYRQIGTHAAHSYWLELLDPLHRPGYQLAGLYETWLVSDQAIQAKVSFWNHIGVHGRPSRSLARPKAVGAEMAQVEYANETGGPARFEVAFGPDRRLYDVLGAQPYSTEREKTVFSGDGWAIFVVSPTGQIYAGSHIMGKQHHSTFLGGRPVMAAGEMVVEDGFIKIITAKSGHYRPTPDDMRRLVNRLTQIPHNAMIRPDLRDTNGGGPGLVYNVGDFRTQGTDAPPLAKLEVLSRLPLFGKQAKAMQEMDKLLHVPARMLRKMK